MSIRSDDEGGPPQTTKPSIRSGCDVALLCRRRFNDEPVLLSFGLMLGRLLM